MASLHNAYLRRLASLTQFFLPYGQVGAGIPGGLEAAIRAVRNSLPNLTMMNLWLY